MTALRNTILWFGPAPLPGLVSRLAERGLEICRNPEPRELSDWELSVTRLVVLNHDDGADTTATGGYGCLRRIINHGAQVLIIAKDRSTWPTLRLSNLIALSETFDWDRALKFMPDCSGVNFDEFITIAQPPAWHQFRVEIRKGDEELAPDEELLVQRAFPKAEELTLREIPKGFSGSRVFMAYEKRKEDFTSIAHWTQPRLVKIGPRESIESEIRAMQTVSPFIPFDLRPNLDIHVQGFEHGVFVADFVEGSESMLEAAHAGRGEAALSNLFNRTMGRWRERGSQRQKSNESLADAAERLKVVSPELIHSMYTGSREAREAAIDVAALWAKLKAVQFAHRVATIHGDLHGENVRVRGDNAILIDLGSVKGDDSVAGGAPLCFDVAMLEVALVFTWAKGESDSCFGQAAWRQEIEPYYRTTAICKAIEAASVPHDGGWVLGCLQRIRAFGVYQQDDWREYPLALAIAMLRMCKFPSKDDADKGRRVYGLLTAARIIDDIVQGGDA